MPTELPITREEALLWVEQTKRMLTGAGCSFEARDKLCEIVLRVASHLSTEGEMT